MEHLEQPKLKSEIHKVVRTTPESCEAELETIKEHFFKNIENFAIISLRKVLRSIVQKLIDARAKKKIAIIDMENVHVTSQFGKLDYLIRPTILGKETDDIESLKWILRDLQDCYEQSVGVKFKRLKDHELASLHDFREMVDRLMESTEQNPLELLNHPLITCTLMKVSAISQLNHRLQIQRTVNTNHPNGEPKKLSDSLKKFKDKWKPIYALLKFNERSGNDLSELIRIIRNRVSL